VRYRLFALDVDGTLVDHDTHISPRLRAALLEAQGQGVRIALCTGRPWAATRRYLDELATDTPPVVFNGALVPGLNGGGALVRQTLPAQAARQLVAYTAESGDYLELHTDSHCYVRRLGEEGAYQAEKLGIEPLEGPLEPLLEREVLLKAQIVVRTEESRRRLVAFAPALRGLAMLSWGVSPGFDGWFVNVMREGVDKRASLDVLLRALGIGWEEVLAAGDSPSDLAYVSSAGYGVIMGNAPREVLAKAPRVAPPVEEDGLAQIIEQVALA
jgi:hypothetical protein